MAKVSVETIKATPRATLRRENSHARLAARKIGLDIPEPVPSLPKTEQEAGDIN